MRIAEPLAPVYIGTMATRAARPLFASSMALTSLLLASGARADGRFSWTRGPGAESCLSEEDMRRKIADIVGVDPFGKAASPTVAGIVRRQGDMLVANISLEQPGEATTTRGFQSNDMTYGPPSEAVALAVALSVERSLTADAAQPPDTRLSPEPETGAWPLREARQSRSC